MVSVPLRTFVIPAVLISLGLVCEYAQRHAPSPASRLDDLVPNPEAVPDPVVVAVESPPPAPAPIDTGAIVNELRQIGGRVMDRNESPPDNTIAAIGACTRPTAVETAALRRRLATWIDDRYPGERADAKVGLELGVGCKDPDGLVIEAHADRGTKARRELSRWWILRAASDGFTILAERTSSATDTWMEWAQEGSLTVLSLGDLDRDGKRDVLYTRTEHEGGAVTSDWELTARLATGERKVIASHGVLDVIAQDGRAVLALGQTYDHLMYRCIEPDLALSTCPAAVAVRRHQALFELAQKYAGLQALPDREQLADDLVRLGVAKADRARLVAAAPAPTALDRAQRHVAAFSAKLDADDDLGPIQGRPHAEAETYFQSLRRQLGDTACAPAEISATDRTRIDAWIAKQPLANKMTRRTPWITPVCGAYAWAAWDDFPAINAGIHREVLLVLDDLTPLVAIQREASGDPTTGMGADHAELVFRHGATVVVAVQHDHRLDVIANGKLVGRRAGDPVPYTFDPRWADASDDLFQDVEAHAWLHPTPAGLEQIDPEPLAAHEARRAAMALIRDAPSSAPAFVHALQLLGAEPALVREVRALPAA